jgi:hypothetical protein
MALERYGFLQLLRDKGFENLLLSTDTSDSSRHTLRIHFDQRDRETEAPDALRGSPSTSRHRAGGPRQSGVVEENFATVSL